ncbi:unnamed protein product [Eruca vesicaria subsp. sativa]|uniref:GerMN domain-containing protein n=1 Tax=Eruca vesicaria subsp. sativa TaxID=29727 RepID=A0ABC8L1L9_ERUVS|nr:unnamed protein product [Eruca vesicaria subsp. sativa]
MAFLFIQNCITPKVPGESINAKNIINDLSDQALDQILGQELSLQKTVLTTQYVPFLGKLGAFSMDIISSPAINDSMSLQVAISHKDNSVTFSKSLLDAKVIFSSTLACTSSAHTSLQVMDNVPSEIIVNEGITLSENDPLKMTNQSKK